MEFPEFKLKVIKKYFDIEKEEDARPVVFLCLQNNKTKLVKIPEFYLDDKEKMHTEIDNIVQLADPKYVAFCAFSNVHKVDSDTGKIIETIEAISMMFEDGVNNRAYTVTFRKTETGYKFENDFDTTEPGTEMSGRFLKSK